ncbi:MAG: hypothetical protein JW791_01800, partial [Nanoarchaeota archaeon]|nr:hypothetical protein [Nanoarchaeota archaeon]
ECSGSCIAMCHADPDYETSQDLGQTIQETSSSQNIIYASEGSIDYYNIGSFIQVNSLNAVITVEDLDLASGKMLFNISDLNGDLYVYEYYPIGDTIIVNELNLKLDIMSLDVASYKVKLGINNFPEELNINLSIYDIRFDYQANSIGLLIKNNGDELPKGAWKFSLSYSSGEGEITEFTFINSLPLYSNTTTLMMFILNFNLTEFNRTFYSLMEEYAVGTGGYPLEVHGTDYDLKDSEYYSITLTHLDTGAGIGIGQAVPVYDNEAPTYNPNTLVINPITINQSGKTSVSFQMYDNTGISYPVTMGIAPRNPDLPVYSIEVTANQFNQVGPGYLEPINAGIVYPEGVYDVFLNVSDVLGNNAYYILGNITITEDPLPQNEIIYAEEDSVDYYSIGSIVQVNSLNTKIIIDDLDIFSGKIRFIVSDTEDKECLDGYYNAGNTILVNELNTTIEFLTLDSFNNKVKLRISRIVPIIEQPRIVIFDDFEDGNISPWFSKGSVRIVSVNENKVLNMMTYANPLFPTLASSLITRILNNDLKEGSLSYNAELINTISFNADFKTILSHDNLPVYSLIIRKGWDNSWSIIFNNQVIKTLSSGEHKFRQDFSQEENYFKIYIDDNLVFSRNFGSSFNNIVFEINNQGVFNHDVNLDNVKLITN